MGKRRASRGWTLAELLCGVGLTSVMVALALPSFAGALARSEQRGLVNDLFSDLALARSEAIQHGKRVVMCKSSDQSTCLHESTWQEGWIVFVDANNNAQHDASETLLQVRSAIGSRWRLTGNGSMSKYVSYHPNGRTRQINGGFQAGTFKLCDSRSTLKGDARVIISATGRPRIERSETAACGS